MPNWVECDLNINGNKKDIARFKKFAKGKTEVIDTNKFIPYPKKFREADEKADRYQKLKHKEKLTKAEKQELNKFGNDVKDGFNNGGYNWCCNNWGTKWGLCNTELSGDYGEELNYYFETAWSEPKPIILKMSKMFKKLEFVLKYFEGGNCFNGLLRCKGGKIIDDLSGDYFGNRGG